MNAISEKKSAWPIAIVIVAVLLCFGRLATAEFTLWDDDATLTKNYRMNPPSLANVGYYWTHSAGELYIPVTYTVWAILASVAQLGVPDPTGVMLNPMVFHLANVFVHACSACLVMAILTRLTRHHTAALIGALLYAVHPVQVETVAWASGMKDLLWGCFSLGTLNLYIAVAQSDPTLPEATPSSPALRRWQYVGATACLVLAMLSKPSAMVTPAVAAAIDFVLIRRPWKRIARSTWFWVALTIPLMITTRLVQLGHAADGGPILARPLIVLDSLAFYVWKLIWPFNLTCEYAHRPINVLAGHELWWTWIVPLTIAVLALGQYRRRPWIAASCAVFVLGMFQMLGWLPFSFQFFSTTADHYLYLSMLGVAMLAAYAIAARGVPRSWIIASTVVLVLLGARSIDQEGNWADGHALYTHMMDVTPNAYSGYYLLGQVEVDAGHYAAAEPLLRKALAIEPRFPRTHDALATVLIETGRTPEAIEHIKLFVTNASPQAPQLRKQLSDAHSTLGLYYLKHGDKADAAKEFNAALKLFPDDATLKQLLKQVQ